VEFDSPPESFRFFAARPPRPPRSPKLPERSWSWTGSAFRDSCPHGRHYVGCPSRRAAPRRRAVGEGCQPLAGAVLRVLAPLDGSGCTSRRDEPLARPDGGRDAPTLCGLVPCRSRPWSCPSELPPLEEPYPLSRALASLRVRVRPLPARRAREVHDRFPRRADPLPWLARRLAGRRGRDDGSSQPLRRSVVRAAKRADRDRRSRSRRARRLTAGTPASKPCSPREVRARDDPFPGRGGSPGRCSPGLGLPFRARSSSTTGSVSREAARKHGSNPRPMRLQEPDASRRSRGPGSDPGL
jgi:hypothetical protein